MRALRLHLLLLAGIAAAPALAASAAPGDEAPAATTRTATPPQIDPSRFGEPVEPRDAIGEPPIRMLDTRDVTPKARQQPSSPAAAPADSAPGGIDPDRFGERPADVAYGAFQRGLYKTAYNLALERAKNGDPAAQTLVAEILSRGLGMKRDDKGAAGWYQRAAEQGVPEAQFQYALMLLDGKYVEKDEKQAFALMQAAAEAGNRFAQFNLAQMVMDREIGDEAISRAVDYYERAAKAGLADAQYAMAQVRRNGIGGRTEDLAEARKWLTLAARQNYDTAQLELGTWLVEGRGGAKDEKSGFNWLMRAAQGGNVAAQNRLAKLYMHGLGTEPDSIAAAAWYILALRSGLTDPVMDDFMDGLTDEEQKTALERANRLR